MIKSLDRISYLTNSLEEAEKTFSAFFGAKPLKKVISKDRNYESMLYGFENMHFEIIKKNGEFVRCIQYTGMSGTAMMDVASEMRRKYPKEQGYTVDW